MSLVITEIPSHDTWPIRHKVMWPDQLIEFVKLPEDASGLHYGLEFNNELVSIVSLFINKEEAQFRKFATITSQQGNGFGTTLLTSLIEKVKQLSIKKLWCNARRDKTGFYEKFGMTQTDNTFTKAGIDYVIMEKYFN